MSQIKTFGKNEVIFQEGAYERCMYEIQSGSVNIYVDFGKENEKLLTTLEAGRFFGEIGIAEVRPRTATAIAAEDHTSLVEITRENFKDYFRNEPQKLIGIMQHMSKRLRGLTLDYLEARETIAEAINAAKSGKKQSGALKDKLAKLVQNLRMPSFLKARETFEEAAFLNAQENPQRVIKTFKKNEVIFREGDAANCLYDIHWGKVGIYANYGAENQRLLTELNPDEFFGEMGLLERLPRSSTAVALEDDTNVQLISEEVFNQYLQERPAKVLMIMMQLSLRIRELTQDYLEACRLAETAATVEDEQAAWTNHLSEDVIAAYSTYDYYSYCHDHYYWM